MKTTRILIIMTALIMTGITVQAEQKRGPVPATGQYYEDEMGFDPLGAGGAASEARREEVRKKVEAVRMWRLTEELKLDEKTSTRLASFLSSIEEKRRALMQANLAAMRDLRASLKTGKPDERTLKTGLDKIEKNQRDLVELREKELSGIKEMLNAEQQARYLVFQQEFRREMRRMIAGARANGQRSGMRGNGPGISQGPGAGQRGPERPPAR